MNEFEIGTDFYVQFNFREDVSSYGVTVEYHNDNGSHTGLTPSLISGSTVKYDIPKASNNVVGTWQFKVKIVKSGKTYKTEKKFVNISPEWD